MAEWSIAAVLKTVELRGSGGSNPSLSARTLEYRAFAQSTPDFTPECKVGCFLICREIPKRPYDTGADTQRINVLVFVPKRCKMFDNLVSSQIKSIERV